MPTCLFSLRSIAMIAAVSVPISAASQEKHPVEKYRRIPVAQVTRIPFELGAGASGAASLERLVSGNPLVRIGALEAPAEQVFGSIADIVYSGSGELLLLDGRLNRISVFAADGMHVETFSRSGMGPGELRQPKAMALTSDGRLFVADAARRVHIFDRRAGGFTFNRTERLPMDVADMCELNGRLIVLGNSFTDSTVLHRFDHDLKLLGSFGVVYRSGDQMLDYQAGQGELTCIPDQDAIVMTPLSLLGEIRSYSGSGVPRWVTRIDGMTPIIYELIPNGYRTAVPEGGYHRFLSIVRLGATEVLVQVATVTIASREEQRQFAELSTFRLRIRDGHGELVSRSIPLLSRLNDSVTFVISDDPYPFVELRGRSTGEQKQ